MADIQKMLELSTLLEKKGGTIPSTSNRTVYNKQDLDALIDNFDKAVYGPINETRSPQEKKEVYSAEAEMEQLLQREKSGNADSVAINNTNMPKEILESIINNPLDYKPSVLLEETGLNTITDKLAANMEGIRRAANIVHKVEQNEKEAKSKLVEQLSTEGQKAGELDYARLKSVIESVFDDRINELAQRLNESVSHQRYVPTMKVLNFKDKFYFVDNDDNVFECEMKYRGKNKKR